MHRRIFPRRSWSAGKMPGMASLSSTYWVFVTYLIFVFLMGSGSRGDIISLILLRPVAVLVGAWALLQLNRKTFSQWRSLLLLAGILFLITVLHLLPLPAPLWHALPGRELVIRISEATGSVNRARPLSLSPIDTVNALCSLFVPTAALLLAINLDDRERRLILPVLLGLGALTAGIGILQAVSPGSSRLHFYRVDSMNAASGLFANRNHQAFFLACLLPMLAIFGATSGQGAIRQKIIVAASGILLLPLLLVTGSRAGLVLGVIALIAILALMVPTKAEPKQNSWRVWATDPRLLVGGAIVFLGAVILLSRRAEAFKRLFGSSVAEESRLQIWQPALRATWELMPFGSGIGSFVRTYQVYETDNLLTPTYRNHAHNDFIEIVMTGGLPALLILLAVIVAWSRFAWKWMRLAPSSSEILYGRLGTILLLLSAIASAVDYPIRVPSLSCFLVVAAVWMRGSIRRTSAVEQPQPSPQEEKG